MFCCPGHREPGEDAVPSAAPRVRAGRVGGLRVLDGLGDEDGRAVSQVQRGRVLVPAEGGAPADGHPADAPAEAAGQREPLRGGQLLGAVPAQADCAVFHLRLSGELRARTRQPHLPGQLHVRALLVRYHVQVHSVLVEVGLTFF